MGSNIGGRGRCVRGRPWSNASVSGHRWLWPVVLVVVSVAVTRLGPSLLVDNGLATERSDHLACERKGRLDGYVCHAVNLDLGYIEERFPDGEARVAEHDVDVGVWPVRASGAEGGLDFFVVVVGYW